MNTYDLIKNYYNAFNAADSEAMLELIDENVAHYVNEGHVRHGKAAFRAFNEYMAKCYSETLRDIVIFVNESGDRAAAEFIVDGKYLADDEGLPAANGQGYSLPAGAFFTVENGKIARVTTYYNLQEWIEQVSA